jgi:hypothetical protein
MQRGDVVLVLCLFGATACEDTRVDRPEEAPLFSVAAARDRVCAIRAGELFCFGSGIVGELLDATHEPTRIDLPGEVIDVTVGPTHACAVVRDEGVYCWGTNQFGELGIPSEAPTHFEPAPVRSSFTKAISKLAATWDTTCGLEQETGRVLCVGATLGDGLESRTAEPSVVPPLRHAVALSASEYHLCALEQDGAVVCWGAANQGQLGHDPTESGATGAAIAVPNVEAIAVWAAPGATCVRTPDDQTLCWGQGAQILAPGYEFYGFEPTAVSVEPYDAFSLYVGYGCGRAGESLSCWGYRLPSETAEMAELFGPEPMAGLTGVGAFAVHGTGGCAWGDDGLACWGSNHVGQAGAGTEQPYVISPVVVLER